MIDFSNFENQTKKWAGLVSPLSTRKKAKRKKKPRFFAILKVKQI